MNFEVLSIEEKVNATLNYFKYRDKLSVAGKKEASQYTFNNACKIRTRLRQDKRGN